MRVRLIIFILVASITAVFLVWGIGWPESWLQFIAQVPVKALMFCLVFLLLWHGLWSLQELLYYPEDPRQMIWIVMKRISGLTLLAAGIPLSISFVEFVAIKSGTLAGSVEFADLNWASAVVVVAGFFCLVFCAALHAHVSGR